MKTQSISSRSKNTSSVRFDPFSSRLARDIRNTLSEAFVDALLQEDKLCYQSTAEQWLARNLDDEYAGYIQDRLTRYDHAFDLVQVNRIKDAKLQTLIIWNHGLFFEVHEHLERIWHLATGDEYQALKGLIQAAGVYIHLIANHRSAAERLAIKSLARIQQYADQLGFIANLDVLLNKLTNMDSVPPQLKSPAEISVK